MNIFDPKLYLLIFICLFIRKIFHFSFTNFVIDYYLNEKEKEDIKDSRQDSNKSSVSRKSSECSNANSATEQSDLDYMD
jgi:hypothetical protein